MLTSRQLGSWLVDGWPVGQMNGQLASWRVGQTPSPSVGQSVDQSDSRSSSESSVWLASVASSRLCRAMDAEICIGFSGCIWIHMFFIYVDDLFMDCTALREFAWFHLCICIDL